MLESRPVGEVAEWSIVPDSKSGVLQGTEGSNPSLSATRAKADHTAFVIYGLLALPPALMAIKFPLFFQFRGPSDSVCDWSRDGKMRAVVTLMKRIYVCALYA